MTSEKKQVEGSTSEGGLLHLDHISHRHPNLLYNLDPEAL
jgi:hypothetical protein